MIGELFLEVYFCISTVESSFANGGIYRRVRISNSPTFIDKSSAIIISSFNNGQQLLEKVFYKT